MEAVDVMHGTTRPVAAMGLIRLRVAVLALIMAVLALAAGRIFDSVQGSFVLAAVLPIGADVPRAGAPLVRAVPSGVA